MEFLAADHLFDVNPDDDPDKSYLIESKAQCSHSTIAKLQFWGGHMRLEIQTVLGSLTIRVKQLDKDNLGKLKQCLQYL